MAPGLTSSEVTFDGVRTVVASASLAAACDAWRVYLSSPTLRGYKPHADDAPQEHDSTPA